MSTVDKFDHQQFIQEQLLRELKLYQREHNLTKSEVLQFIRVLEASAELMLAGVLA